MAATAIPSPYSDKTSPVRIVERRAQAAEDKIGGYASLMAGYAALAEEASLRAARAEIGHEIAQRDLAVERARNADLRERFDRHVTAPDSIVGRMRRIARAVSEGADAFGRALER